MKIRENLVATHMQEVRAENHSGFLTLELYTQKLHDGWNRKSIQRAIADPDSRYGCFFSVGLTDDKRFIPNDKS